MDPYADQREHMVKRQLAARGIHNKRVLNVMRTLPRHLFVPPHTRHRAYEDGPLAIGDKQTISQPFIVAYMTQALALQPDHTVLEIGTGSGYQTAILAHLAHYVYSLERFPRLADLAGERLSKLEITNVDIHIGDGSQGLPDMAPYDAIIVTAAAPMLPGPLCTQLYPNGGRLVIPVGDSNDQSLKLVIRKDDKWQIQKLMGVRFVPLIGRYGFKPEDQGGDKPAGV